MTPCDIITDLLHPPVDGLVAGVPGVEAGPDPGDVGDHGGPPHLWIPPAGPHRGNFWDQEGTFELMFTTICTFNIKLEPGSR